MAIRGVFQAGSLLSGLGTTSTKLKEVQQRSKSTTTEMKRMTSGANMLKTALAAIGVAGFSALLMTTPQLVGSLAKIKSEMQRIAWSIGKHLKPALDAVGTILRGIRTGDWSTVKKGIEELGDAAKETGGKIASAVLDPILGKETTDQMKTDFNNWLDEMAAVAKEKNLWAAIWHGAVIGVTWFIENLDMLNAWCDTFNRKFGEWSDKLTNFVTPEWMKGMARDMERFDDWVGKVVYKPLGIDLHGWSGGILGRPENLRGEGSATDVLAELVKDIKAWGHKDIDIFGLVKDIKAWGHKDIDIFGYQTGGHVPRTGMYKLHAGETVTMRGSTPPGGATNAITLDFSGANFVLNGGIELDQFAETLSNKIAERQSNLTY